MNERVYWASIVLDTIVEDGSPWVLFINARPTSGTAPLPVDGPLRLAHARTDEEARESAEETLRGAGWCRSTAWEQRPRGWVCWLRSTGLDEPLEVDRAVDSLPVTTR